MRLRRSCVRVCMLTQHQQCLACSCLTSICPLGSFVPRRQLHTCAPSASASTMKADTDDAAAAAAKKARKAAKKEKKLRDKADKEAQMALGEWCTAHAHRAKRTPCTCSVSLRGIAAHSVACTSTTRTCSARLACWRNVIKRTSSRSYLVCLYPSPFLSLSLVALTSLPAWSLLQCCRHLPSVALSDIAHPLACSAIASLRAQVTLPRVSHKRPGSFTRPQPRHSARAFTRTMVAPRSRRRCCPRGCWRRRCKEQEGA